MVRGNINQWGNRLWHNTGAPSIEFTLALPHFLSLSFFILSASSISGVLFLLQCSFHSCSTITWEKLSKELRKEGKVIMSLNFALVPGRGVSCIEVYERLTELRAYLLTESRFLPTHCSQCNHSLIGGIWSNLPCSVTTLIALSIIWRE